MRPYPLVLGCSLEADRSIAEEDIKFLPPREDESDHDSDLFRRSLASLDAHEDSDEEQPETDPQASPHDRAMRQSTMSRGTKRGRTDFEPGNLVANLVEAETPVKAEWLDSALRDVSVMVAPHISYVSAEDLKRLTDESLPPPYQHQLVTSILQSKTLLMLVDVGASPSASWAAVVMRIADRRAYSASLFDPSPCNDHLQMARPIFDTFVDRILTSTPPERRVLRSALAPPQEIQADNGVVLFATVLCAMSGVIVPATIHVPI